MKVTRTTIRTVAVLLALASLGYTATAQTYDRSPTDMEAFVGVSNTRVTAGVNKVMDLSKRFSFAYGLSYSRYYQHSLSPELNRDGLFQYSINVPAEIRYYILPKDNRLTAFLFCSVTPMTYRFNTLNASLKAGAALQYKINNASSVYFRVLAYQNRMPNNGPTFSSLF